MYIADEQQSSTTNRGVTNVEYDPAKKTARADQSTALQQSQVEQNAVCNCKPSNAPDLQHLVLAKLKVRRQPTKVDHHLNMTICFGKALQVLQLLQRTWPISTAL